MPIDLPLRATVDVINSLLTSKKHGSVLRNSSGKGISLGDMETMCGISAKEKFWDLDKEILGDLKLKVHLRKTGFLLMGLFYVFRS